MKSDAMKNLFKNKRLEGFIEKIELYTLFLFTLFTCAIEIEILLATASHFKC